MGYYLYTMLQHHTTPSPSLLLVYIKAYPILLLHKSKCQQTRKAFTARSFIKKIAMDSSHSVKPIINSYFLNSNVILLLSTFLTPTSSSKFWGLFLYFHGKPDVLRSLFLSNHCPGHYLSNISNYPIYAIQFSLV